MIQMVAPYESASFVAKINRFEDRTYYSHFGNGMFWLCAAIVAVFGVGQYLSIPAGKLAIFAV
jgi:hypothetical protein